MAVQGTDLITAEGVKKVAGQMETKIEDLVIGGGVGVVLYEWDFSSGLPPYSTGWNVTLSENISNFTWLEVTTMYDGSGYASYDERIFDTGIIPAKLLTPGHSASDNPVQFVYYDKEYNRVTFDYIYGESTRLSAGEQGDHWAYIVRVVGYK